MIRLCPGWGRCVCQTLLTTTTPVSLHCLYAPESRAPSDDHNPGRDSNIIIIISWDNLHTAI